MKILSAWLIERGRGKAAKMLLRKKNVKLEIKSKKKSREQRDQENQGILPSSQTNQEPKAEQIAGQRKHGEMPRGVDGCKRGEVARMGGQMSVAAMGISARTTKANKEIGRAHV